MSAPPANSPDLVTSIGVGALSVIASIAKAKEWQDPKTGKINAAMLASGLAASLVLAAVIRAAGVHFGVEPWAQVAAAGVLCYVGPDPIIRAVASAITGLALKRLGVQPNEPQNNDR